MRWSSEPRDWKRHFALLPITVRSWKTGNDETIWLGWCWRRFCGDCYEVRFTDPAENSPISRAEGAAGNPATVTPNTSNQQDGGER